MTNHELIKIIFNQLKPVQRDMYRLFLGPMSGRKYIIHCSRRLGKTYLLCALAITMAISKPNAQIRYASVTQKAVRKMIHPIFKIIFGNVSESQKPRWNSQEGAYIFSNGSMIHIAGVNNGHEDDLRGTDADLAIVDEAAFVDQLSYLVDSVLMPQLINTGGKLIMASSSPISPAHEFTSYIQDAQINGYYSAFDIHQSGYEKSLVEEFCIEAGGSTSTAWRREYLNELIVDTNLAIVPEWNDLFIQDIKRDEFYQYYHRYESMDVGVRDNTAILFGHYDFKSATLKIEHEFVTNGIGSLTRNLSENIDRVEKELEWTTAPYMRISDNNNLNILQDLGAEFDKHFHATNKETKAAMINAVRLMVQDGRIVVHPRCTQLIGCLKFGVFQDTKRKDFGRSKSFGHYDALDALIYLVRNLNLTENPIPKDYRATFNSYVPQDEDEQTTLSELKKIFR